MKQILKYLLLFLILIVCFIGWRFFGSATVFSEPKTYLEIPTGSNYEAVKALLIKNKILPNTTFFQILANRVQYPEKVKAGRYEIKKGTSLVQLVRMLSNGTQHPVQLTISKLRTKEDFAALTGRKFEFDSAKMLQFLNNNDSLKSYGVDSNTIMTLVLPNTYTYFWNATPAKVCSKLKEAHEKFWTRERIQKASSKGLNPQTTYILASIVEEETNKHDEKGNVASVYLNRMNTGMRLGADPTVKFALKDFSLKRIYNKHLVVASPYNTYRVSGLPPGPICTPSAITIDAVLNAPSTNYLYFVAKSDFSGYHQFAATYPEHLQYAKQYQQALDQLTNNKKKTEDIDVSQ